MRVPFALPGIFLISSLVCHAQTFVPAGGNTWISGGADRMDREAGITLTAPQSVATLYVRLVPGVLDVTLALRSHARSRIGVTVEDIKKEVSIDPARQSFPVGTWTIAKEGYCKVTIQGIEKSGESFGTLDGITISGSAVTPSASFVPNNEGNFFYWGRRGPSVHLRYEVPGPVKAEYFYSEITVPEGNDVIGSYYMANGFADGYFGIQVNSETERRVLFSVWSPYATDDPKSIPEADRIILLKKGEGVNTGEFGNEGSGGQSYMRYAWKAGTTYGFLLRAQPDQETTIYTAWFFPPEEGQWKLVASFRRPRKAVYLDKLYSFLENFVPETGNIVRSARYGNQWVRDTAGQWSELTTATFTGDNTARKNYRKDYAGGVEGNAFFLKNCGFFGDFVRLDQSFTRPAQSQPPRINFAALP